jgi:glycosyltransferase involved in cell wall biosynthesis
MGDKSYLTSIGSLIRELGMCERIVLLPAVSYSLWYDCLSAADLGIALYRPGNINHVSMAGAATKLNLYLKAGVPSIVPDIPDFVAFIEKYGIGRATCPDDPIAIADAINSVFENSDDYARMCGNARTAFRIEFNFERQIEPILRWLESQ